MSIGTLENLAHSFNARIEPCQIFNPNVGECAHHHIRKRLRGYRVEALLSETRIAIEVKGFETQVSFSTNDIDRICLLNKPLGRSLADFSGVVFVASSNTFMTEKWFEQAKNVSLLSSFHLAPSESLQVYKNAVVLIGKHKRATVDTIMRLCDLVDCLKDKSVANLVDGLRFSVKKLPKDLQHLGPLVKRFAIADDDIRGELLSEASAAERKELLESVEPLLSRINQFLDSFDTRPLSNEAILISRLAEAVEEFARREA